VIDTAVVAAAVAIVTAGCTVECIQWDLRLRNQLVVAAVAVVEANQGSIAGTEEEEIRHLCLGSEKRRWRSDL